MEFISNRDVNMSSKTGNALVPMPKMRPPAIKEKKQKLLMSVGFLSGETIQYQFNQ